MAHYLLKWNPQNWSRGDFLAFYFDYLAGEPLNWACGGTKRIREGDRFFLLKTGVEPRGIIGAGHVTSPPAYGAHYDPEQADAGKTALYVGVHFDHLAHPDEPIPISRAELEQPKLRAGVWGVQGSGKQIPSAIAEALEALWGLRIGRGNLTAPDEVTPKPGGYPEGAVRPVLVNAYERSPQAREACIAHWGARCQVCGFDFEQFYGQRGKGYIQVHHLVPISRVGQAYHVDPKKDLLPICANCHAMVHRTSEPMGVDQLKMLVQSRAAESES
jgi:5-methylcytosine-specific restriction protein A